MERAEKRTEDKSLEESVVELLAERGLTVTTAESCTGGLISGTLVNAAGASEVLNEAYITYSNEAKQRLVGVRPVSYTHLDVYKRQPHHV